MSDDVETDILAWRVRVNVDATRNAYAAVTAGGADTCRCDYCANWVAQRSSLLAGPVGVLLDRLGIDGTRDVEVVEYGPEPATGLRHYEAWYDFIGEIVAGVPARPARRTGIVPPPTPLSDRVGIRLTDASPLAHHPFAGKPLVRVEIAARLPWAIEAPEPR